MSAMAKTRPPKAGDGGDEAKRPNRSGSPLNFYVDEELRKALDAFIADYNARNEHPASLRSTLEAALKAYLKGKGFWPPKADG